MKFENKAGYCLQGKNRSFPDVRLEKPSANFFFATTSFFLSGLAVIYLAAG